MGEVINFGSYSNKISYDNILTNDPYLRTTALNALSKKGYEISRLGVLQFQTDCGEEEPDGILGIKDFPYIITFYDDADTRQEIINYVESARVNYNENATGKKVNLKLFIFWLILLCFFEFYGVISCILDIYNHFIK